MGRTDDDKPRGDEDWIDRVVKAAGKLGMNEVRVRWKLQAWVNRWHQRKRRAEQKLDHIRYEHKHCPACRALQDRDARECSRCGARMGSRTWQVLGRMGLAVPRALSISSLLGVAIAVVYIRVATAGGAWFTADMDALIRFGASLPPEYAPGEWWRYATSVFLHAGLWHLGFNLIALAMVGPLVEELYGRRTMLIAFMVTGIAAAAGSAQLRPDGVLAVGIGASGAIMGLIGVAAAWGHRKGTSYGKRVRDQMLMWTVYVFVFGFFIGADNWAHAIGLVVGAGFGYAVDPGMLRPGAGHAGLRKAIAVLAVVAALACAATVAAALVPMPSAATDALASPPAATPGDTLDVPAGHEQP